MWTVHAFVGASAHNQKVNTVIARCKPVRMSCWMQSLSKRLNRAMVESRLAIAAASRTIIPAALSCEQQSRPDRKL
jgi:hypothetical protein